MNSPRMTTGDHLRALRLRKEGYDWGAIAMQMKIPVHILRDVLDARALPKRVRKKVLRETSTQPPTGSD